MTNTEQVVAISIMDRTYQIKCQPEEVAQLHEAARYLDEHMRKLSQGGQTNSTERLAIVTALNIVQELLMFKNQKNAYIDVMHDQIKSLQSRIQQFLTKKEEAMA